MKNILVTGGAGFLGKNLLSFLKEKGYNVFCLDNAEDNLVKLEKFFNIKNTIFADISTDFDIIEEEFKKNKFDVVIHAAALKHVHICEKFKKKAYNVNVIGTQNIVDLCKKYNVKNMLFISTDKSLNYKNYYGMTKHIAENYVFKNNYKVFRGVNFFYSTGSVLDIWEKQLLNKKSLTVTKEDCFRYFNTVEEVCNVIYADLFSDKKIIIPKSCFKISIKKLLFSFQKFYNYNSFIEIPLGSYEKIIEEIDNSIDVKELDTNSILEKIKISKESII